MTALRSYRPKPGVNRPRPASTEEFLRGLDEPEPATGDNAWAVGYLDILLVLLTLLAVLLGIAYMRMDAAEAEHPNSVAFLLNLPSGADPVRLESSDLLAAVKPLIEPEPKTEPEMKAEPKPIELPVATVAVIEPAIWSDSEFNRMAQLVSDSADEYFDMTIGDRQIRLEVQDDILFGSGSAELEKRGKAALKRLAEGLNGERLALSVEGHTDDRPISTPRFPSNWELSSYRATTVARYLIDQGLSRESITVAGFADTRPVAPNDSSENRARNRRVSIVLRALEAEKNPAPESSFAPATGRNWARL